MTRHRYEMQVETPHGITEDESVRRLRAFLKMALRGYGVRCLSVERITHGDTEATAQDDPQQAVGDERDN